MTYDRTKLKRLGKRRQAALAELEKVRQEVTEEIPEARKHITWREISGDSTYTEQQLRTMAMPAGKREEQEQARRQRRRKGAGT